jgi:hypothetical protein
MPAPTVEAILRLEDAVVAAALDALNNDTILGNIAFGLRKLEGLPKSRIDVAAEGFSKASEQMVYAQGTWWDSHFSGQVTLTISTHRGPTDSAWLHSTRVGRCRYLMTPKAQIFTAARLPYVEVLAIDQGGTRYEFDVPTDTDRTELTFTMGLGLLAAAFPA